MASYAVVRRYKITELTGDIGAECKKRGIDKVPLLPKGQTPAAKDGQDGANAKNETKQIIAGLTENLGEPSRFLGL